MADNLIRDGYNADALHGELSQQQRDLTMQKFRQHRTQLLVATDVAARGLDVDDLTHVINYGMPDDTENYTHRSGRTGRAGKKGTSICIVHVREKGKIRLVEKTIQKEFVKGTLPSGKDICAKQLYRVIDDIEHEDVDEEEIQDFLPEVSRRWEWLDKEDLIKRVLSREFGRFLQYYANAPEIEEVADSRSTGEGKTRRKKGDRTPEEGFTRIFVTLGKTDGYYAKELIRLVNTNVKGKVEIGKIDLVKNFSFIEVAEEDADRVIQGLKGLKVKGRTIDAEVASPEGGKGEGGDRPKRERKGGRKNEGGFAGRPGKPGRSGEPGNHATPDAPRTMNRAERRAAEKAGKSGKGDRRKPSREERGYTEPRGKKFAKEDWMKFLHPDGQAKDKKHDLRGDEPDFSEEGWARRYPKKK